MKKTAVDFLFFMLNNPNDNQDFNNELLEKAKEIEKQQIIDAYNSGQQEEAKKEFWTKGAKYYEETFNK